MRHACLAVLLALAEAREFEFVSAERAGSRRSCGGAHYVPGTHSGELHAKALERRQREREEQALLEPSFLETAMVPPAMQMPSAEAIGLKLTTMLMRTSLQILPTLMLRATRRTRRQILTILPTKTSSSSLASCMPRTQMRSLRRPPTRAQPQRSGN